MFRCSLTDSVVNLRRDRTANPYHLFAFITGPPREMTSTLAAALTRQWIQHESVRIGHLIRPIQRMTCKVTALFCPAGRLGGCRSES